MRDLNEAQERAALRKTLGALRHVRLYPAHPHTTLVVGSAIAAAEFALGQASVAAAAQPVEAPTGAEIANVIHDFGGITWENAQEMAEAVLDLFGESK